MRLLMAIFLAFQACTGVLLWGGCTRQLGRPACGCTRLRVGAKPMGKAGTAIRYGPRCYGALAVMLDRKCS